MDSLIINQTSQTPRVVFDAETGSGEIIGVSFPEHANDFYAAVHEWIDQFFVEFPEKSLHVAFNLNYFNTASNKELRLLMKHLDRLYNEEKSVSMTWFHEDGDEDMEDVGKGYSVSLNVPVSVQAV
ncbi:MAG: DUF1987 domain-containing protein [Candidatus Kapaibacterium sp.]|nr:MAG: DUF1987 domain-containing protein [Candidatus Kapabacteria bacterium]